MRRPLLLLPLLALTAPLPAQACAVVVDRPVSIARLRVWAAQAIERATAIVDGEVIRPLVPGPGGTPALVRVHRRFKGPEQAELLVGEGDSCSIALTARGERSRMILTGGPDIYYLQYDGGNARAEDRLLGSDRRRDWPYVRGVETAP